MAALVLTGLSAASTAGEEHDRNVARDPVAWTPSIEDGAAAFGTATVDGITVVGGSFTQVRERGAASTIARSNIFAFDSDGDVSNTFVPDINTRVWDVIPAGDGQSVFVGGQFNRVNGLGRTNRIARVNVHTGQVMTTFRSPGFNGKVIDLEMANGRLYVGGYFSVVGGQPHTAMVALNPDTGAISNHLTLTFSDVFRDSSTATIPTGNSGVGVERFAITPDGSRLIAIGNFRNVDGQSRVQVAMVDTSGAQASLTDWQTTRYSTACSRNFPTYTTGVDTSPDGSYFAITTGGAFNGGANSGTLCDTVARWETNAGGPGQNPTWVDYMGGDTASAVHITGSAVYVGGHFRWANNPYCGDCIGPGTVKRSGLAALDPRNGLPLTFNAGKLPLRWGVMRFESTDQGLWIAHDGNTLGGEPASRIGLMPLTGGKVMPDDDTGSLPGDVLQLGRSTAPAGPSPVLHRVNTGGPEIPSTDGLMNWAADQDATSPLRTSGSNTAPYSESFGRTAAVPSSTPTEVFSTERWDPSSDPRMEWDLPVTAGVPLQVRLYFANAYSGTSSPGSRVFDVDVEGSTVLDDYDIAAEVGHLTGTMKSIDISAAANDGNVDIDFSHVIENPLINAIEIVRTDITPPVVTGDDNVYRTALTETAAGTTSQVSDDGVDWSSARGAFMADGRLYTAWADGTFTWRPYGGGTFGTPRNINLYGLTAFASEMGQMRSMWFDRTTGRLYFTLNGQNQLYYRYFTPESLVVGGQRFTAPNTGSGIDWSTVRGGFLANGKLFYSSSDGNLRSAQWATDGPVSGTIQTTSGPSVDGKDWSTGALALRAQ